jgi:hypothetical protein
MLFDAHNQAVLAELEHVVCGTDKTADHATLSPLFAVKFYDGGPTT